jgi:hypothetical protein
MPAVITPLDDFPIHQTPLPIAHTASGDPNHYDRYWFNGYREDLYFGVAMATYPNRDIIDAAFSVVSNGRQRSVFASGRLPLDRRETRIGPISIEVVEPLRVNRVRVDAPEHGIVADLTYRARTVAIEEPRQTMHQANRLVMDSTRLTQWGGWSGTIDAGGEHIEVDLAGTRGTKDRSWGVRPVGAPAPIAPQSTLPQIFFLWAPLQFDDCCTHFMVFERGDGTPLVKSGAIVPVLPSDDAPTWGIDDAYEHLVGGEHHISWAPGLRRSREAQLTLHRPNGGAENILLDPLLTFRMRGIGYMHPTRGHGHWHDELSVFGEDFAVEELDTVEPWSIHVQQVMRATWGNRTGLGVLEQLAIGPHDPSGLTGLFDGFAG